MTTERIEFLTTTVSNYPKGVSFPVVMGAGGFFSRSNGMRAIVDGVKQMLLTNPGERVMRPLYGAGLRSYVFDPDDVNTRSSIKKLVTTSISTHEPRAYVKSLSVKTDTRWGQRGYNRLLIKLRLGIHGDSFTDHIMELII